MYPRADIIIFGLWDGIMNRRGLRGEYGGRPVTMGNGFNELVNFIRQSDIASDVDIRFVDLMVDEHENYRYAIKRILDSGYKLPLIMINGRFRYAGSIPVFDIYNEAKMINENGCMIQWE